MRRGDWWFCIIRSARDKDKISSEKIAEDAQGAGTIFIN